MMDWRWTGGRGWDRNKSPPAPPTLSFLHTSSSLAQNFLLTCRSSQVSGYAAIILIAYARHSTASGECQVPPANALLQVRKARRPKDARSNVCT